MKIHPMMYYDETLHQKTAPTYNYNYLTTQSLKKDTFKETENDDESFFFQDHFDIFSFDVLSDYKQKQF
jgi:hypothetical protein